MAQNITVTPDNFQAAMRKLLKEYGEDAFKICDDSAKTAARQATSELKKTSPTGATGRYARGWSHKTLRQTIGNVSQIIYNRTDYQLTHLLEKPHETGYGGSYPRRRDATGRIAAVEEKYGVKFYEGVIDKL